jgi:hypothetical protein
MKKKDDIDRLTHIHYKKVEMELAREAAMKATEDMHKKAYIRANKLKAESK